MLGLCYEQVIKLPIPFISFALGFYDSSAFSPPPLAPNMELQQNLQHWENLSCLNVWMLNSKVLVPLDSHRDLQLPPYWIQEVFISFSSDEVVEANFFTCDIHMLMNSPIHLYKLELRKFVLHSTLTFLKCFKKRAVFWCNSLQVIDQNTQTKACAGIWQEVPEGCLFLSNKKPQTWEVIWHILQNTFCLQKTKSLHPLWLQHVKYNFH